MYDALATITVVYITHCTQNTDSKIILINYSSLKVNFNCENAQGRTKSVHESHTKIMSVFNTKCQPNIETNNDETENFTNCEYGRLINNNKNRDCTKELRSRLWQSRS